VEKVQELQPLHKINPRRKLSKLNNQSPHNQLARLNPLDITFQLEPTFSKGTTPRMVLKILWISFSKLRLAALFLLKQMKRTNSP
jgi:hypothetical protein